MVCPAPDLGLKVTDLLDTAHALRAEGRFREALEHAREVIALLEGPVAIERFGRAALPYCVASATAAACLGELGDHPGALALIARGRAVAGAAGHPYSQAVLAIADGQALACAGRAAEAISLLESAVATCREQDLDDQLISALSSLGHAYALAGRGADAVSAVQESIDMQGRGAASVSRTHQSTVLAAGHLVMGDLNHASRALEQALAFAEEHGERGLEGWARLTAAELALARDNRVEAEQQLDAAQEIAEELEMAPLVARCRALARRLA
ncbi:MAG: hypothetical protein HYU51_09825 [Candidatus Rokubacteria bacterium]|nr:hypothetical protein [Candidatus Rokubacteria bacterium]